MAVQTAIQPGARGLGAEKLAHHREQVIQRQQQGFAQLHGDDLLLRAQGSLQAVRRVGFVGKDFAPLPLVDGAKRTLLLGAHNVVGAAHGPYNLLGCRGAAFL